MEAAIVETKLTALEKQINFIKNKVEPELFRKAKELYEIDSLQLLSQGKTYFEIDVDDKAFTYRVSVEMLETPEEPAWRFETKCNCKSKEFCSHQLAVLFSLKNKVGEEIDQGTPSGKQYTKEGMIRRVLQERKQKAFSENYRILFVNNVYGEHILRTEKDVKYKLTFRSFEKEIGYCSCPDFSKNKLGTCKHLIYAFDEVKKQKITKKSLANYPFIEVFLDPQNDYQLSYYYPQQLNESEQALVNGFFNAEGTYKGDKVTGFLHFIKQAEDVGNILIRKEVYDLVETAFDDNIIEQIKEKSTLDLSPINAELFQYQKEGIEFAAFKKGAIIADEMGLGKTLQAIAIAIVKKQLFGFKRILIICPASLKGQWKKEIEKFSNEKATVVSGYPEDRAEIYANDTNFFQIINYETVLRDKDEINKHPFDFIILDEAQRIKNFETITANAIKGLKKKHGLVITGTPIENKLIDLYSIVEFLDDKMLTPMWEFSYQYCFFDETQKNKITGYTNLQQLKKRISPILLRRTKKEVIKQVYDLSEITIPVALHPKQRELHASFASGIAKIIHKKFKTSFDWQRITMLLQSMRMVCNSTYLIDGETNFSPKLAELKDVLFEKLDLQNNQRKIIIFSEWIKSHYLIAEILRENNIGFTELNGKVPVAKRQALIEEFEQNDQCRVFLSTEAGGSGLNLQVADTVINFELPWNPAKKNQRIGRIDRLGQKNENLTVINFLTTDSIEMKIASGLMAKQELFDNVLNSDSTTETVDFSDKGRAQFLQELELSMQEFTEEPSIEEVYEEEITDLIDINEEEQKAINLKQENTQRVQKMEEMEAVMQKGMEFLTGMFKMATGKDLSAGSNKIEIDKETGEVVMRFKMDI